VFDLFNALDSEGKTMVVVTHDKALSERAERVLHLLDGRISKDVDLNGAYTR
jgi:putative ABC transport system ATP-binding protein